MKRKIFIAAFMLALSGTIMLKAKATGSGTGNGPVVVCEPGPYVCYISPDGIVYYGKLVIIEQD